MVVTCMVRVLPPWHENVGKRQVKAPKIYLADSGLLHALLDIGTSPEALLGHPRVGASWEGFALHQIVRALDVLSLEKLYVVHAGAAAWPMDERIEAVPLIDLFAALRDEREHA